MTWDGKTVSQWVELTNDPRPETREHAVNALGYFGDDANSALPVLRKLLDDRDAGVRDAAARALNNVTRPLRNHKPAIQGTAPELANPFDTREGRVRMSAARELGSAGVMREVDHSVSAWIERTKDPSPRVREQATIALHYMGPDARAAIPAPD